MDKDVAVHTCTVEYYAAIKEMKTFTSQVPGCPIDELKDVRKLYKIRRRKKCQGISFNCRL